MSIRDVLISDVIPDTKGTALKRPTTLEAYHQQKMSDFETEKNGISELRAELNALTAKMESVSSFSDEWRQLSDAADELRKQIRALETDDKRLDYFLDVGDMLFQYYDAQESIARGDRVPAAKAPMRMPANSVLSYFAMPEEDEDTNEDKKDEETDSGPVPVSNNGGPPLGKKGKQSAASHLDFSEGLNRDKMMEKYLAIVDPAAIKSGIMPGSGIEPGWGSCPICDVEMTFYQNEALLGCPRCGHEEFILIDSEKPSYKDPPREVTYFAYKKINHFNEWLAQFQAKENTDIPQDVVDAVMAQLRKERITDPKHVKKEKIREILQKLKMSKMYDHIQQIKNRIQHQMNNLVLTKEMEEKLQHMFKEIQPSFIKYIPKGRSNFLSYPYVLYKFCQLLDMDEFLPCFQLLKSREKLYDQDQVWKKICADMQWQFIKSI